MRSVNSRNQSTRLDSRTSGTYTGPTDVGGLDSSAGLPRRSLADQLRLAMRDSLHSTLVLLTRAHHSSHHATTTSHSFHHAPSPTIPTTPCYVSFGHYRLVQRIEAMGAYGFGVPTQDVALVSPPRYCICHGPAPEAVLDRAVASNWCSILEHLVSF